MKVYQRHEKGSPLPYLDNCYVALTKENEQDIEVTSYESLLAFTRAKQIDYITFRATLKTFDFNSLSENDKVNLVNHYIAPNYATMLNYKTANELELIYAVVVAGQKDARQKRYDEVTHAAGFEFRDNQMYQFMSYSDIKLYKEDYINVDYPALLAFATSTAIPQLGIDFTTTGFASKVYYSEILKNKVVQILTK